ncbi:MAG: PEP-CTERM sorting domain-containing protein [Luteolibacter sp.]
MKYTNTLKRHALLAAAATVLASPSVMAANSFYAAGDLVLYFQKEGSTNTVYANLGAATQFRGAASGPDATSQINFLDINSTLTSAFGAGWASDATIYAGLAGVNSSNSSLNTVVNGDPFRTIYISASRDIGGTVGSANSTAWVIGGNTAMTDAATRITTQNDILENNYDVGQTLSLTSISQIDDQNPLNVTGSGTFQGAAFNNFAGGVMQLGTAGDLGTFGDAGTAEFNLDLYRIVAKTGLAGEVAGDLRSGSYEGTMTVNSSGLVSFTAIPEPSASALAGIAAGALVLRRRRRSA